MSGDGLTQIQTAVYTVLNGDSTLGALVNGVYDFVPSGTNPPYVTIGDDTMNWDGTMTVDWQDATLTIHSWAYGEGRKSCKDIMSAVYDALHKVSLSVTGKTHVSTLFEFADIFQEDDGIYHGVQRFRVITHDTF